MVENLLGWAYILLIKKGFRHEGAEQGKCSGWFQPNETVDDIRRKVKRTDNRAIIF